jgi:hypothetical protein
MDNLYVKTPAGFHNGRWTYDIVVDRIRPELIPWGQLDTIRSAGSTGPNIKTLLDRRDNNPYLEFNMKDNGPKYRLKTLEELLDPLDY